VAQPKEAHTVGAIARGLNRPLHRVEYAIRSRGIVPSALAGHARVFDADGVEQIAAALNEIDNRRKGGGHGR
jgi:hypothetical protein